MTMVRVPGVVWALVLVLLSGVLLGSACGGGGGDAKESDRFVPPKEDKAATAALGQAVDPLATAHEALRDFLLKIEAGLTFGDILRQWPEVSVVVSKQVERTNASLPQFVALSQGDFSDVKAYAEGIDQAYRELTRFVRQARELIDGTFTGGRANHDEVMRLQLKVVSQRMSDLTRLKEKATNPG